MDGGEAVWCTTTHDRIPGSIKVVDKTVTRRPREEGFKALGVWIIILMVISQQKLRNVK